MIENGQTNTDSAIIGGFRQTSMAAVISQYLVGNTGGWKYSDNWSLEVVRIPLVRIFPIPGTAVYLQVNQAANFEYIDEIKAEVLLIGKGIRSCRLRFEIVRYTSNKTALLVLIWTSLIWNLWSLFTFWVNVNLKLPATQKRPELICPIWVLAQIPNKLFEISKAELTSQKHLLTTSALGQLDRQKLWFTRIRYRENFSARI